MPPSLEQCWDIAFGSLPETKRFMFGSSIRMSFGTDKVVISFPNAFALGYFEKDCLPAIKTNLCNLTNREVDIVLNLDDSGDEASEALKSDQKKIAAGLGKSPVIKKEPVYILSPRPDLTFAHLVVGDSNRSAFLAATAFVEQKKDFDVVMVTGGTGVGKTLICWATHQYATEIYPDLSIPYPVHAKAFKGEFTRLAGEGKNANWRPFDEKYRYGRHPLFFDDIHHLTGEKTISQFNDIFESALNRGVRMLITSRWSLSELESAIQNKELISRLRGSMVVKIEPPDFEMKVAILLKKAGAEPMPFQLGNELAGEIVRKIPPGCDGRALAGLIKSVKPEVNRGAKINLQLFSKFIETTVKKLDFETIIKVVAEYFKISVEVILSRNRMDSVVWARHIAFYLCHKSIPEINNSDLSGRFKKDRSTIAYGIKEIEASVAVNRKLREDIEAIEVQLLS